MNYDLAKKLKDAGFPQKVHGQYIGNIGDINHDAVKPGDVLGTAQEDFCYIPTLEELIEACGDNYFTLHTDFEDAPSGLDVIRKWKALTKGVEPDELFDTPSEAVANLWLTLQDK